MGNRNDSRQDSRKQMVPPSLEFLFEGDVVLGEPLVIGQIAIGRRLVYLPEPGARIDGPHLHGQLLTGSVVTELVRPDGVIEVTSLIILAMSDGDCILARTEMIVAISSKTARDLAEGRPYDPDSVYSHGVIHFEAAEDGPYSWLNRGVYICRGRLTVGSVKWMAWQVTQQPSWSELP